MLSDNFNNNSLSDEQIKYSKPIYNSISALIKPLTHPCKYHHYCKLIQDPFNSEHFELPARSIWKFTTLNVRETEFVADKLLENIKMFDDIKVILDDSVNIQSKFDLENPYNKMRLIDFKDLNYANINTPVTFFLTYDIEVDSLAAWDMRKQSAQFLGDLEAVLNTRQDVIEEYSHQNVAKLLGETIFPKPAQINLEKTFPRDELAKDALVKKAHRAIDSIRDLM